MTHTDADYRSNASILAIGTLSLHRETLQQLTGDTERRYRGSKSSNSGTSLGTCFTCRGHTCNKHCPTAGCY